MSLSRAENLLLKAKAVNDRKEARNLKYFLAQGILASYIKIAALIRHLRLGYLKISYFVPVVIRWVAEEFSRENEPCPC